MELNLTTLAERRLRGDLIETFRVVNGHVDYGHNVFNVSKFGNKLSAKSLKEGGATIKKFLKSFLPERIRNNWNLLPIYVRNSVSVPKFRVYLEYFKRKCVMVETGNYWEVSNIALDKIEGPKNNQNKQVHNEFLRNNALLQNEKVSIFFKDY